MSGGSIMFARGHHPDLPGVQVVCVTISDGEHSLMLSAHPEQIPDWCESLLRLARECRIPVPDDPGRPVPHHGSGPDNQ